uniref:Uncharacterized protein n=1 Tax=Ananas comosus var. bracteatus TaxID=296719 RepID=A0A6V7PBS5_ANACO|nr:unnamed protein product [Ananas comosus var. bracteatus]
MLDNSLEFPATDLLFSAASRTNRNALLLVIGPSRDVHKPLVLKELKKLWNKDEPDLPWKETAYCYFFLTRITLAIENDNSLGQGGDLRVYLEKLAVCDDLDFCSRKPLWSASYIRFRSLMEILPPDKMENISASAL